MDGAPNNDGPPEPGGLDGEPAANNDPAGLADCESGPPNPVDGLIPVAAVDVPKPVLAVDDAAA